MCGKASALAASATVAARAKRIIEVFKRVWERWRWPKSLRLLYSSRWRPRKQCCLCVLPPRSPPCSQAPFLVAHLLSPVYSAVAAFPNSPPCTPCASSAALDVLVFTEHMAASHLSVAVSCAEAAPRSDVRQPLTVGATGFGTLSSSVRQRLAWLYQFMLGHGSVLQGEHSVLKRCQLQAAIGRGRPATGANCWNHAGS